MVDGSMKEREEGGEYGRRVVRLTPLFGETLTDSLRASNTTPLSLGV